MSSIAIVVVAYYFGIMSFVIDHAWLVVPLAVVAWGLLFVPSTAWTAAADRLRRAGRGRAHALTGHAKIVPSHSH